MENEVIFKAETKQDDQLEAVRRALDELTLTHEITVQKTSESLAS